MPLHTLPAGRQVIEGLHRLGQALGYEVERERAVGEAGAAVDLAWYAAGEKAAPLMIFEVESSPSSSMANNAMKVLARDVDDFVKPLFFFHVLLVGGPDNDRIVQLRRQWGAHNYRVYRLNDLTDLQRLVLDILEQHRRVRDEVSVVALGKVLQLDPWSKINHHNVFDALFDRGFAATYARDLAKLAIENDSNRGYYLRYLRRVAAHELPHECSYESFVGYEYGELLELGLLVAALEICDEEGAERLEAWQQRSGYGMRTIGAHFGLSKDYDAFVLGVAPFLYGLLGLLTVRRPVTFSWFVSDLRSLLLAEQTEGVNQNFWMPAALWLAHLSSAGLGQAPAVHSQHDALKAAFDAARKSINDAGGVPANVLFTPPICVYLDDPEAWLESLAGEQVMVPDWPEFNRSNTGNHNEILGGETDPASLAIAVLLWEEWPFWNSVEIVRSLRAS